MLPLDISRCVGRKDLTAESEVCPVRSTCERFTAIGEQPNDRVWVTMWLCEQPSFEQRIEA